MWRFWRNPEFVRHCRAELRRTRVLAVLTLVVVVCLLVVLGNWASRASELAAMRAAAPQFDNAYAARLAKAEAESTQVTAFGIYVFLIYLQVAVLTFWSLLSCAQSISREREQKTWDFQRTTRLSPAELLIGKLVGEPVLAYFIVACCLPFALAAGLVGRVGISSIVSAYVLVLSSALFAGVLGLWLSGLVETRSRGIALLAALVFYAVLGNSSGWLRSQFPGYAGFSPLTGLRTLIDQPRFGVPARSATIFGTPVPWLLMSVLLYAGFGAWLAVMVLRNLKKEREEMRLLSRWQVVGCSVFLNFLSYAVFNPNPWYEGANKVAPGELAELMLVLNGLLLFALGLATLTPAERLKAWWRLRAERKADVFSEDGLSWPWLALSTAAAYGLLVWGLSAWKNAIGSDQAMVSRAAVLLFVLLVFVARDVMLLQWFLLTRMRAPILKGILCLGLYYSATGVVGGMLSISSGDALARFVCVFTPVGAFLGNDTGLHFRASVFVGLAIQLVVIGALMMAINRRLSRPAMRLAMAGD